ncbi:MAG: hypothetical protein JSV88_31340 [Candidatus Aminicenantes bacterium]|nr:MAG: hypothetical protein JSV88_31340 [Candidatus Aminicenantes bacterium]
MKKIFTLFLLIGMIVPVCPAQDRVIPDIYKPESITVDENCIYITQDVEVFIYSKKDVKLVKKFGKAGEGPREFKKIPAPWIPSITLYLKGDQLLINSLGKISLFSKDGEFISETPTGTQARYIPVGDKYIYMHFMFDDKVTYIAADLVDANLKNKIELCRFKFPAQTGKKRDPILMARMSSYFDRYAYKDKFVFPTDNNNIRIFNSHGKEVTSFTPPYTKVPINGALKKTIDEFFSKDIRYKMPYLADKNSNLIALPEYMPIFKDYRLADNKIYILSNFKKDGKFETFIYDFSGKLLKKTFIPLVESDMLTLYPFYIKDSKIYQLVLGEDEEEFFLRITNI